MAKTALLAAVLGLGMALSGPVAAQQPQYGGTLTVAFASDTKTLDPTFSINFSERQPLYLLYNTLLSLGTDLSIQPELAERYELTDGGNRLVLHLRRGVKFHDGTDFNAEAVKFNLDRRMDPAVASPQRTLMVEVVEGTDVVDPYTVAVRMKAPSPGLLGMLAQREGFMVSPAAAAKYGKELTTNPVGTGPFVFKEWVPGNRLVVEKNPNYWEAGKPYLDRVVFADITNNAVAVQRIITGEADFISAMSPLDVRQLEGRREMNLVPSPVGRWYAMQWQVDKPPFNNEKVRQAIAHAIDRKRIVDILMGGKAPIAEGVTPPGLWWFDPTLKSYPYDPAKAKALLAEAGLANGLEVGLSTPTITLLQQLNQLVQEQLKAVGITARLEPVAQSDWYPRVVQGAVNFTPIRWALRPDPDGLLTLLFHSKGSGNSTKYRSAEVDGLLDRARSNLPQAERQQLYRQAQQAITRDLPYVPLFFSLEYAAMRDTVKNFVWIPDEIPRFREVWKARAN